MQGDIFQLESLTAQVAVPRPQPATAQKPKGNPQVAIYNEDDLSHLLYVSNNPHHHHRHHHHHHHHEQRQFVHPADNGTVLVNNVMEDMEFHTPALSDCESCSGSECSGTDVDGPVTPPFEELGDALDAYRQKGRRGALKADYGFPVFLGRQDEEWNAPEVLAPITTTAVPAKHADAEEVPASAHVDATEGPVMSWWPEPLDEMRANWALENKEWDLEMEKEKQREREREACIVTAAAPEKEASGVYTGDYSLRQIDNIEGHLMGWWPAPLDSLEYEWSDRFYE